MHFLQLMPTSCKTALQHSRLQVANWFSGADNITSVSAHVFTTGAKSLLAVTSAVMEQHTTITPWQADVKNCPQTCLNKCIRASLLLDNVHPLDVHNIKMLIIVTLCSTELLCYIKFMLSKLHNMVFLISFNCVAVWQKLIHTVFNSSKSFVHKIIQVTKSSTW